MGRRKRTHMSGTRTGAEAEEHGRDRIVGTRAHGGILLSYRACFVYSRPSPSSTPGRRVEGLAFLARGIARVEAILYHTSSG